jgi:hypothetical protein
MVGQYTPDFDVYQQLTRIEAVGIGVCPMKIFEGGFPFNGVE